ncbi:MAG: DUF1178 family protein [Gammaproteobacteria bacterium]|nr:DUF1178 family protein [Gammaproteobacteria bacterium]
MIIFDFECDANHRFEGWFKNKDEFTRQVEDGLLNCPVCDSAQVHKIPSATNIIHSKSREVTVEPGKAALPAVSGQSITEAHNNLDVLQKISDFVEKNYDDVGDNFSEEAKRIHYGETEAHNIRGTASPEEVTELRKEGISALPLPGILDKKKLN